MKRPRTKRSTKQTIYLIFYFKICTNHNQLLKLVKPWNKLNFKIAYCSQFILLRSISVVFSFVLLLSYSSVGYWVFGIHHSRRGQFLPSLRFYVHFKRPLIILSSIYVKYMLTMLKVPLCCWFGQLAKLIQ